MNEKESFGAQMSHLHTTENVKEFRKEAGEYVIKVHVRYDDTCRNGHNSFGITCDAIRNFRWESGGCQHDLISEHFPELRPYLKWHLASTDGPMHYIENTVYWAQKGHLEEARRAAVWPDATLEQLQDRSALLARLPDLMKDFRTAIESLGFVY
jgi:hypothetical protein